MVQDILQGLPYVLVFIVVWIGSGIVSSYIWKEKLDFVNIATNGVCVVGILLLLLMISAIVGSTIR